MILFLITYVLGVFVAFAFGMIGCYQDKHHWAPSDVGVCITLSFFSWLFVFYAIMFILDISDTKSFDVDDIIRVFRKIICRKKDHANTN